jgi:phospholipid/cholesterol/gamma-HCH transport system permease protein
MTARTESAGPGPLGRLGKGILEILEISGEIFLLFLSTVWHCRSVFRHRDKVLAQLVEVGSGSLAIAALVSLFVGMVMVVQAADQLATYTQEILGFLVAGKIGSAVAAEVGSMKVYDEISALKTMDIDPVPYLAMPRFVAMTLAVPMLTLYSDAVGIFGGGLVIAFDSSIQISVEQYLDNMREWINLTDIGIGLVKGMVFGMIIAIVACAFGFRTTGGSEGVARSTTSAVVWSFVMIIIADYVLVRIGFLFLPAGGGR